MMDLVDFIQVAEIRCDDVVQAPLDMWASFDGQGFDGKLFLTTGGHVTDDAHGAAIFAHDDSAGDEDWVEEHRSEHRETAAKIRDWTDAGGLRRLYAWLETPRSDETVLLYRDEGSSTWINEAGTEGFGNVVGGRGLGVNYFGESDLFCGFGEDSDPTTQKADNVVLRKSRTSGMWTEHRRLTKAEHGLVNMRELEFDEAGNLWEFHRGFPEGEGPNAQLYVGGVLKNAPADGIRQASWYPPVGKMFVTMRGPSHNVRRGDDAPSGVVGPVWAIVHSFEGIASHVLYIPRGDGELWAVGQDPLDVVVSPSGAVGEWAAVQGLPRMQNSPGGASSPANATINHNTAIGFYAGRVWIAARDQGAQKIRVYREDIEGTGVSGGGAAALQVI